MERDNQSAASIGLLDESESQIKQVSLQSEHNYVEYQNNSINRL